LQQPNQAQSRPNPEPQTLNCLESRALKKTTSKPKTLAYADNVITL
jgi:hypothetical protein